MATHALPAGTCNFPINMKVEEREFIGRISSIRIRSGEFRGVGDYLRHLVLLGLEAESPADAERLKEIRKGMALQVEEDAVLREDEEHLNPLN